MEQFLKYVMGEARAIGDAPVAIGTAVLVVAVLISGWLRRTYADQIATLNERIKLRDDRIAVFQDRVQEPQPVPAGGPAGAPAPTLQLIDPMEVRFTRKVIRVADLAVGSSYIVDDKIFEDCFLYGPGFITLLGHTGQMSGCSFFGHPEGMFIEIPEGSYVQGAIGFRNCVILRCTFIGLGIIGPPNTIRRIRQSFTNK